MSPRSRSIPRLAEGVPGGDLDGIDGTDGIFSSLLPRALWNFLCKIRVRQCEIFVFVGGAEDEIEPSKPSEPSNPGPAPKGNYCCAPFMSRMVVQETLFEPFELETETVDAGGRWPRASPGLDAPPVGVRCGSCGCDTFWSERQGRHGGWRCLCSCPPCRPDDRLVFTDQP